MARRKNLEPLALLSTLWLSAADAVLDSDGELEPAQMEKMQSLSSLAAQKESSSSEEEGAKPRKMGRQRSLIRSGSEDDVRRANDDVLREKRETGPVIRRSESAEDLFGLSASSSTDGQSGRGRTGSMPTYVQGLTERQEAGGLRDVLLHLHTSTDTRAEKEKHLLQKAKQFNEFMHQRKSTLLALQSQQVEADAHAKNQQGIRYQQLLDQKHFLEEEILKNRQSQQKLELFYKTKAIQSSKEALVGINLRKREMLSKLTRQSLDFQEELWKTEEDLIALQTLLGATSEDLLYSYQRRTKMVLSLSGGGIRGILEVIYLKHLLVDLRAEAKKRGLPGAENIDLADIFDVVAGTSTGSFIASALATGVPLEKVESLYKDGARIFQYKMTGLGGFTGPIYRNDEGSRFYRILHEMLSDEGGRPIPLREAKVATIIPAHDVKAGAPIYYNSVFAKEGNLEVTFEDACRASSAAPLYFSSQMLPTMDERIAELSDGGISGCNNPSLVALTETIRMYNLLNENIGPRNIVMFTLGSGQRVTDNPSIQNKGVRVVQDVITALMSGSANMIHDAMKALLPPEHYIAVDFKLASEHSHLDSYKPESIEHFESVARKTYKENTNRNKHLVDIMLGVYVNKLDEKILREESERVRQEARPDIPNIQISQVPMQAPEAVLMPSPRPLRRGVQVAEPPYFRHDALERKAQERRSAGKNRDGANLMSPQGHDQDMLASMEDVSKISMSAEEKQAAQSRWARIRHESRSPGGLQQGTH